MKSWASAASAGLEHSVASCSGEPAGDVLAQGGVRESIVPRDRAIRRCDIAVKAPNFRMPSAWAANISARFDAPQVTMTVPK
jgi:hypothetical protein